MQIYHFKYLYYLFISLILKCMLCVFLIDLQSNGFPYGIFIHISSQLRLHFPNSSLISCAPFICCVLLSPLLLLLFNFKFLLLQNIYNIEFTT